MFKKQLRPDNIVVNVEDFNLKPFLTYKEEDSGDKLHVVSVRGNMFGLVKENEEGIFKFLIHWPKEIIYNIS